MKLISSCVMAQHCIISAISLLYHVSKLERKRTSSKHKIVTFLKLKFETPKSHISIMKERTTEV